MKRRVRYSLFLCALVATVPQLTDGSTRTPAKAVSYASEFKLGVAELEPYDNFGWAVAIDRDVMAIGAPNDGDLAWGSGAVYLFERRGGFARGWEPTVKLRAEDNPDDFTNFGRTVALDGDLLAVSSLDDTLGRSSGAVYLFRRHAGGTDHWGHVAKLLHPDGTDNARFGDAIGISGDTIVVGTDASFLRSAKAYVFEGSEDGYDRWALVAELEPHDGDHGDQFGEGVAIDGDTIAVGAWSHAHEDAFENDGAVYVFERNAGGADAWGQVAELLSTGPGRDHVLGYSVAIEGDTIVAGAVGTDDFGSGSGSAFVFERNAGGWQRVAKLLPNEAAGGQQFGETVDIHAGVILVGSGHDVYLGDLPGDAALVFRRDTEAWQLSATLVAADGPGFRTRYGFAAALSDGEIVVGAARDDDETSIDAGAAYTYREVTIDPFLASEGACPGASVIRLVDATPRGKFELYRGAYEGSTTLATGPCTGSVLGLKNARRVLGGAVDRAGEVSANRTLREGQCGTYLQGIDTTSCVTSNVTRLPE